MKKLFALILLSGLTFVASAQNKEAPSAPMPAALSKASKLFLSNAGDQENRDCLIAYNTLFQGLGELQRFKLVLDPSEADLVIELHYEIAFGGVYGKGDANKEARQFRVAIIDPKTRITLWTITEDAKNALLRSNRDKNLADVMDLLLDDLDHLLASPSIPPGNKSKVNLR